MSSETITRNDLTNILNEVLPTPRYGGVQTASWIANSSNANNVKLTDSLHLTAGTYTITLKYPATSANLWTALHYSVNGGSSTLLDSFCISQGISCSSHSYVVNIPFELDLWAETATSSSITYTYKERGGLRAIQISESSVSGNEADYIVEQGTNANGTYRKWNSGILEQWGHTTIGSNSAATWYYPMPFISANNIEMVASCHYLSTGTYVAPTIAVQPIWTDHANVYARVSTSTVTNAHTVSCYAIGKWK